ncbi:MAG TPA: tetratricopeptide repeat protein [Chloroflexota bacterium]
MSRSLRFPVLVVACVLGAAIGTSGRLGSLPFSHAAAGHDAHSSSAELALASFTVGDAIGSPHASTDALIRRYQRIVRTQPHSAPALINLALAYMQKERETNDVTYYQLTDDALQTALRLDPNNVQAVDYEAWVALGRHDFVTAAQVAQRAIDLNPGDPGAYANLGDAEANLGNYAAMVHAYQRMINLKPSLVSYNRASYARWLYGDVRGAVRFMLLAIRAGSTIPENVAWCESQLGDDYFNDGFVLGAESMYRTALQTFPHYAPALAGLATVEYSLGHPRAAIRYYRQAIAIVPLPQYVTGLGDLYTHLGDTRDAARQYALIHFIDHVFAINHVRYGVETAQYDADHNVNVAQALQIARSEARTRNDSLTLDTLAWAMYRNGLYADALRTEQKAMRLGTHYAPYLFHAGMIEARLGNVEEAQGYLHSALMINPNFGILAAPVARAELDQLDARAAQVASAKP